MIRKEKDYFILDTAYHLLLPGTSYRAAVDLYYGRKLHIEDEADMQPLVEKHIFVPGNVNQYNEDQRAYSLEDMRLEIPPMEKEI